MKKIIDFFKAIEAKIFKFFDWVSETAVVQWLGENTKMGLARLWFHLGCF